MSNSQVFLAPAYVVCHFLLTLFDLTPSQIDPSLYRMMVIVMAIFLWMKFIAICLAIIKRACGFGR